MTLPLATATYTIKRPSGLTDDSTEQQTLSDVYAHARGCTVYLSGTESVVQGDRERVDGRILLDSTVSDVRPYDRLLDEMTGQEWEVSFARKRIGFGLDHWVCGVYLVTGVARGTRDL